MNSLPPAEIAKDLNSIILTCLGGPGGDPDRCHLEAAAKAFVLLRKLGLPIDDEETTELGLREDNIYEGDFLESEGLPK